MKYKECTKCRQNKEVNIESYRQCKYASKNTYFKSICRVCESSIQVARVKNNGLKRNKDQQEKFLAYDKMSWSNYGIYWHIDHIIPQSCLTYNAMSDDNFKKCWSLNNLRPLEAKQNMLDGSTRIRHKMYITNNGVTQ